MLYNPPTGSSDPNAPYVGKNLTAGTQGSKVPPKAVEAPQRELVALISESGQSPTNNDLTQALRAIRGGQLTTFTDTSNAANSIVIAPGTPHTSLMKGLPFRIFPAGTNTSPTIAVTIGSLTCNLRRKDGSAPAVGDVVAGVPIDVVSDGTNLRMISATTSDILTLLAANGGSIVTVTDTTSASTADLLVGTGSPGISSYKSGQAFLWTKGNAANATTTPQGNVSGLGAKTFVRHDGSALAAGDLPASGTFLSVYDGTNQRVVNTVPSEILLFINNNAGSVATTLITNNPSISPPRNMLYLHVAGSGTWTVPANITWIYRTVVGGGGGAGGGDTGTVWSGGGGGGGGTAYDEISVTPGQVFSYSIGAGGAGGNSSNGNQGGTGGTTTFGSSLYATGGGGGNGSTSNSTGGAFGAGHGGMLNQYGTGGGEGDPHASNVPGGYGGASSLGGGGMSRRVNPTGNPGLIDGAAPGSGGAGIWDNSGAANGGDGADGAIIIQW